MKLVLLCVLLEILGSVLVWLVLVRESGKERKRGEIVNVPVSTWYHSP